MKFIAILAVSLITLSVNASQKVETANLTEYYIFGTSPDDPGESVRNPSVNSKVELKNDNIEVELSFNEGDANFQRYAKRLKNVTQLVMVIDDLATTSVDEYTYLGSSYGRGVLFYKNNTIKKVSFSCQQSQYSARQQVTCYFDNHFDHINLIFKR